MGDGSDLPFRWHSVDRGKTGSAERYSARIALLDFPGADSAPDHALSEILKSIDTLHLGSSLTVRPYDPAKLKIVGENNTTVDIEGILTGDELRWALEGDSVIRMPGDSIDPDIEIEQPYFDPLLKDRGC